MSWRVASPTFYLAPGATTRIEFWWGDPGDDKKAQWAMGHPMRGEYNCRLATERVVKRVSCEIGRVVINDEARYSCGDPATAYWRYQVDIRNEGSNGCRFQLEGGGV